MEEGEGSNNGRRRVKPQRRSMDGVSYEESVDNLSRNGRDTYGVVNRNRHRPFNTIRGAASAVFDNTCPPYNWLRPGWIAEERRMLSTNRLYRYYYDPVGQMYSTRQEVENVCEDIDKFMKQKNCVVIVLDD